MSTEWGSRTKYIVGIGLALFVLFVIYLSRSVLSLLIIAALIAYLARPVILFLHQRLRFPRRLATFLTYLLAVIIILLFPLLFIPPIVDGVNSLLDVDYQALVENTLEWLENNLENIRVTGIQILGVRLVLDSLIDPILASLRNVSPVLTPELPSYQVILDSLASAFAVSYGIAVSVAGTVVSVVVALGFMILASLYFSAEGDKFVAWFIAALPEKYRPEFSTLLSRLGKVWGSFFIGQFTLMVIITLTVWIGLTALGLPGAFPLGVLAGVLELIPNLGPILAMIPAVIVALIQGSTVLSVSNLVFALIILGFYGLVQAFENYIIVPRVLGEAVKLHPLVVMTGVLVGATTWGILGALLAAPLIACAMVIISYLYRKMQGEDPFPEGEESPVGLDTTWMASARPLGAKVKRLFQRRPAPTAPEPEQAIEEEST